MVVKSVFDAILQAVGTSFEPGITQSLVLVPLGKNDRVGRGRVARVDDRVDEIRPGISEFAFRVEFLAYGSCVQVELGGAEVVFQDIQELDLLDGPPVVGGMPAYQGTSGTGSSVYLVRGEIPRSVAGGGEGATVNRMAKGAQRD